MQLSHDLTKPTASLSHCYKQMRLAVDAVEGPLDKLLDTYQGSIIMGRTQSPEFVDVKPGYREVALAQCALDRLISDFMEPYINDESFLERLDGNVRAHWAEFDSQCEAMNQAGLRDKQGDKSIDDALAAVKTAWNSLLDTAQQAKAIDGVVSSTRGQNRTYIQTKDGRPVFLVPVLEMGDGSVFSATPTEKNPVFEGHPNSFFDISNLTGFNRSDMRVKVDDFIAQSHLELPASSSAARTQSQGENATEQHVVQAKTALLKCTNELLAAIENGSQVAEEGYGGPVDEASLVAAELSDDESVIRIGEQSFRELNPASVLSMSKAEMGSLEKGLKTLVSILMDPSHSGTQMSGI